MKTNAVDISIIIINWNTKQLLLNCIASIYETLRTASCEIFVVDNGSTDGSIEAVTNTYPTVTIIANKSNLGFARANNLALKAMAGRYAVLLNSDTVLKEGALERPLVFLERTPDAGMCGPQLLNADGSKQASVGIFPTLLTEFVSKKLLHIFFPAKYQQLFMRSQESINGAVPVDFIVGACMIVRKSAIESVGMLDEDYFFLYEEIDWCFRMQRAGWGVYHLPEAEIYHLGGQSMKGINLRARAESWRSRYLFLEKSLSATGLVRFGVLCLGFFQNLHQFLVYTSLNLATFFMFKRMRKRWVMFSYLLLWHVSGRPISMGIPR